MLIFDFDGILLDSVKEVVVTAFNSVTGRSVSRLADVPAGCARAFFNNRFHFRSAGEAPALMRWCMGTGAAAPERIMSDDEYRAMLAADPIPPRQRLDRFFATRQAFIERDRAAWLGLHGIFQPLWDELRRAGADRILIITNKNRAAVLEAAHHFGLELSPENIYSGDTAATKAENLAELHARFGAPHYLFLDDSVHNLRKLKADCANADFSLRLALGAWGYLGPDDRQAAHSEGFLVYDQQDIIALLEEELPK